MGERHRRIDAVPAIAPRPAPSPPGTLELTTSSTCPSTSLPVVQEAWAFHDDPPAALPQDLIGSYYF